MIRRCQLSVNFIAYAEQDIVRQWLAPFLILREQNWWGWPRGDIFAFNRDIRGNHWRSLFIDKPMIGKPLGSGWFALVTRMNQSDACFKGYVSHRFSRLFWPVHREKWNWRRESWLLLNGHMTALCEPDFKTALFRRDWTSSQRARL